VTCNDLRITECLRAIRNNLAGKLDGESRPSVDEVIGLGKLDELYDRAKAMRDAADGIMNRIGQIENGL
jgi:hypothetical protein